MILQPASPPSAARDPAAGFVAHQLRQSERSENFPVALRVLPARYRARLRSIYDVVRVIDELGDSFTGDRTAALGHFAADLATVWTGPAPRAAILRQLLPTVRECGLDPEPFQRLIRANVQDQRVTSYPTYADLLHYCSLSAEPIGRLVLAVFGAGSPEQQVLSDRICTALQLLEHWQDVGEDRRAGRIYLPAEDRSSFGVSAAELAASTASPALRRLMRFETDRAENLLDSGAALPRLLAGWARIAVCGYIAGGRAAVDSLRRSGGDVLSDSPRVRRADVVGHLLVELARALR